MFLYLEGNTTSLEMPGRLKEEGRREEAPIVFSAALNRELMTNYIGDTGKKDYIELTWRFGTSDSEQFVLASEGAAKSVLGPKQEGSAERPPGCVVGTVQRHSLTADLARKGDCLKVHLATEHI